jgi:DNA-binding NarL/FixJ family response regulator
MDTRPNVLTALTKRQRQVATLACNGFSNKEIAAKLLVAEGTVKVHLHAVYDKLNIHSRTKLLERTSSFL